MELHASCAARDGAGVLLLGPPGAGKSDVVLRLLDQGFELVADDRVVVEAGMARARAGGEGLLEVRGLGVMRLPYREQARLCIAVRLTDRLTRRLPIPCRVDGLDLPAIELNPAAASAAARIRIALDCVLGKVGQIAGFVIA